MNQGEGLRLQEHAGADAEFFPEEVAVCFVQIAEVADDGVTAVEEMAADLVKAAAVGFGLDQGEVVSEMGEVFKCSESGFFRSVFGFAKREIAVPRWTGGVSVDDGEVGFFNVTFFEGLA